MNEFQKKWKELAAKCNLTSSDMAILALSRAVHKDGMLETAQEYLKKSFRPITNKKKLANGAHPYLGLWMALFNINTHRIEHCQAFKLFEPLWTEEQKNRILSLAVEIAPRWGKVNL